MSTPSVTSSTSTTSNDIFFSSDTNMTAQDVIHEFWLLSSVTRQRPPSIKKQEDPIPEEDFELFINNLSRLVSQDEFKEELRNEKVFNKLDNIFESIVNNGFIDNYLLLQFLPGYNAYNVTDSFRNHFYIPDRNVETTKKYVEIFQKRIINIQLILDLVSNGSEIANKRYENIDTVFGLMKIHMDSSLEKAGLDVPKINHFKHMKWGRVPMYEVQHMQHMTIAEEEEYLKSEHMQQWMW